MISTRAFIAGIAGGILALILGMLIYGFALKGFMTEQMIPGMQKESSEMILWAMILGHVFLGFLFVYIFDILTEVRGFVEGLKRGATIGFLMAGVFHLIDYGSLNKMSLKAHLIDMLAITVVCGIVGGIVARILGKPKIK